MDPTYCISVVTTQHKNTYKLNYTMVSSAEQQVSHDYNGSSVVTTDLMLKNLHPIIVPWYNLKARFLCCLCDGVICPNIPDYILNKLKTPSNNIPNIFRPSVNAIRAGTPTSALKWVLHISQKFSASFDFCFKTYITFSTRCVHIGLFSICPC